MNIGDVCVTEVVSVDGGASVQQAAALMREQHVGALLVVGATAEGARAITGIVTDRDIAIEAVARGLNPAQTEVTRIANSGLAALPAESAVDEAITLMKQRGVRRLLVSAEGGQLYGIVSLDDLLGALGHEMAELAHAVHKGMERERAERKPLPAAPTPQRLHIPLNAFA